MSNLVVQVAAILFMIILSYLSLTTFGRRKPTLGFTREEKTRWDELIAQPIGTYFTVTAAVGVFVGLANPFLFFVGASKAFGIWVLICCASLVMGAPFTMWITRRFLESETIKALQNTPNQTGGVIASLFWHHEFCTTKSLSRVIRIASLANIGALIWLEFAVLTEIARSILGIQSDLGAALFMSTSVFVIVYFTLSYGIRGFVFIDAIQSPVMIIGILVLFGGALYLAVSTIGSNVFVRFFGEITTPAAGGVATTIFFFHVLVLNFLQVPLTEAHWLRVWAFGEKQITKQPHSVIATAITWLMLISIGFCTYIVTHKIGDSAFFELLQSLGGLSVAFLVMFWMAAFSAVFSTADAQIYGWLLVYAFDTKVGRLKEFKLTRSYAITRAVLAAAVLGLAYYVLRISELPISKILFTLIPFSLAVLPAFVSIAFGRRPSTFLVLMSIVLYLVVVAVGFQLPAASYDVTLVGAFVPLLISLAVFLPRYRIQAQVNRV